MVVEEYNEYTTLKEHIYTYVNLLWWNIFKTFEVLIKGDVNGAYERLDLLIRVLPNEMVGECKEMLGDMIMQAKAECDERCGKYVDKITVRMCMEKCRKSEIKDGLKAVLEHIAMRLEELGYKRYIEKTPKGMEKKKYRVMKDHTPDSEEY